MHIGIIAALDAEARVFGSTTGMLLGQHTYRVVISGPGQANAARTTHELVRAGCDVLLSWGLAGGLDRALVSGDVVVAERLLTRGGHLLEPDDALVELLHARLAGARRGTVLSLDHPAAGAREKMHLRERFAADAVDMESTAVAHVARSAGRSFMSVRAIVDPAAFEVPEAALAGMGENGALSTWRTLNAVLAEPAQIPRMLRLAAHYRQALRGLRDTVQRLQ